MAGDVPELASRLTAKEQTEAAEQWLRWWRALVDLETRLQGGYATAAQRAWRAELDLPFDDVGTWPAFEGLADRPALAKAVAVTRPAAEQWLATAGRRSRAEEQQPARHWAMAKRLADAVIAEHQLSPDEVRAVVLELEVPGEWYLRTSPGVVLAARDAFRSEATAGAILRSAFWSSF